MSQAKRIQSPWLGSRERWQMLAGGRDHRHGITRNEWPSAPGSSAKTEMRDLLRSRSFNTVLLEARSVCPSISIDPDRLQGRPCITGTRIPVHLILWAIEQKGTIDGVLESYPELTVAQIKDALYFAQTVIGSPGVIKATSSH